MTTSTRPGDVLAGRYRLIDLLTESRGGRFWRAHDNVLERFVALHVIPEDDHRAPLLLAAARESATVLDARILRVLDAEMRDGRCFVVNEWGTGTSLDILVTHGGPLGPRRSAWLAAEVAGAIATAHSRSVAHGRLNPENVLIDRLGAVRLIGLCVDAALHGIPAGRIEQDRQDLGGILYCSLTGTWPGPSDSIVPAAPHEHDAVLSPRQVRAGVPRPLELLWTDITEAGHPRRRWQAHHDADVSTASAVRDRLMEFLGDPNGLSEALAGSIPPINEIRPVVLPQVPEMTIRDFERPAPDSDDPPAPLEPAEPAEPEEQEDPEEPEEPPIPSVSDIVDLPTEAGMPVFGDPDEGDDEVAWLRARSTPPPPPPPFDEPPVRPLFAPEPPDGAPPRRPRTDVPDAGPTGERSLAAAGFWPWDTGAGGPGDPDSSDATAENEAVPGRSWLRLAMVVAACLALLIGVAVAFNLGRGRTPLGAEREEPTTSPTLTTPAEPTASPLVDVVAGTFDPLGTDGGVENDDAVALAVDGDPSTTWSTSTYQDQLGRTLPALKSGVGVYLDLGVVREVAAVDLDLVGSPTEVELYVSDDAPTAAPTGQPLASDTVAGDEITLEPESPDGSRAAVTGRYVLVWFTSLPVVSDGFRAGLAEVVVRGR
ncbi:protein kinase family protein [Nocardioides bizhenqiangii]|uniref:Protein kinase family protein n=1 Tax=Nocardioides bizhenqiangii TaxID=3095076 RepID=A0ABZ0ZRS7_9ACTN|nr:protein kinase family protein [Nocardioides sp. HM61]WQQ26616.1 protein kinase family protein [Nocardioides sp. HM61]